MRSRQNLSACGTIIAGRKTSRPAGHGSGGGLNLSHRDQSFRRAWSHSRLRSKIGSGSRVYGVRDKITDADLKLPPLWKNSRKAIVF